MDEAEGEHRLVFLSAVDNVGEAALVIEGRRASRAEPTMSVEQVVRRADGSTRRYGVDGELRLRRRGDPRALAPARLRALLARDDDGEVVARDRKTGFCLGDRFNSEGKLPNEPARPVWVGECGRGGRGLLSIGGRHLPRLRRRLRARLEGQYLVLDGLPAGRYRLWHRANPERALRESNYANNALRCSSI